MWVRWTERRYRGQIVEAVGNHIAAGTRLRHQFVPATVAHLHRPVPGAQRPVARAIHAVAQGPHTFSHQARLDLRPQALEIAFLHGLPHQQHQLLSDHRRPSFGVVVELLETGDNIASFLLPQIGEVIGQHGADHTRQYEADKHGGQWMAKKVLEEDHPPLCVFAGWVIHVAPQPWSDAEWEFGETSAFSIPSSSTDAAEYPPSAPPQPAHPGAPSGRSSRGRVTSPGSVRLADSPDEATHAEPGMPPGSSGAVIVRR